MYPALNNPTSFDMNVIQLIKLTLFALSDEQILLNPCVFELCISFPMNNNPILQTLVPVNNFIVISFLNLCNEKNKVEICLMLRNT